MAVDVAGSVPLIGLDPEIAEGAGRRDIGPISFRYSIWQSRLRMLLG
jgi:hypothetical protein